MKKVDGDDLTGAFLAGWKITDASGGHVDRQADDRATETRLKGLSEGKCIANFAS